GALYFLYSLRTAVIMYSSLCPLLTFSFFFFHDTATTEIYTLSLHDALPICSNIAATAGRSSSNKPKSAGASGSSSGSSPRKRQRSEEHTSELQSLRHLVCRLLLEKKKKKKNVNKNIQTTRGLRDTQRTENRE